VLADKFVELVELVKFVEFVELVKFVRFVKLLDVPLEKSFKFVKLDELLNVEL
jgi:hypothetical protein